MIMETATRGTATTGVGIPDADAGDARQPDVPVACRPSIHCHCWCLA